MVSQKTYHDHCDEDTYLLSCTGDFSLIHDDHLDWISHDVGFSCLKNYYKSSLGFRRGKKAFFKNLGQGLAPSPCLLKLEKKKKFKISTTHLLCSTLLTLVELLSLLGTILLRDRPNDSPLGGGNGGASSSEISSSSFSSSSSC